MNLINTGISTHWVVKAAYAAVLILSPISGIFNLGICFGGFTEITRFQKTQDSGGYLRPQDITTLILNFIRGVVFLLV